MAELKKDETKRMLGRQPHVCKICGAEGDFETYLAREMMQGTKEEFVYFACERCKCLQIAQVPENLGDYYGENYYSMQVEEFSDITFDVPVSSMSKVLDVGCGAGAWLLQKAASGWGNLYGCDPFLDHDRHYGDRVHIRSCSIHEMEGDGSFDIIQMSDSFEHMADPLEVLKSARRLLKEEGVLYMTIPTYPNIAFERYGSHWYQLDAPRHLFLHSKESLELLARDSGMFVFDRKYNSNASQFVRSYFYQHSIPYYEQEKLMGQYFDREKLEKLWREAKAWNEKEYGDHMEVYLRKAVLPAEGKGKKVIFQRFVQEKSRYSYPYPPVYREPDTDYICFTRDAEVHSNHWKVQQVESLEQEALEPYLKEYDQRRELTQEQIQMGPLFQPEKDENLVTVPNLEELPFVKLDLSKFEPTADEEGKFVWRRNPVYQKGKYKGRPLLLTIGVPVSNQIETIDRCLSHVKPLLGKLDAELVVIDTGSTDGTVEVCRSYGARVYSHPWHDNMSAVRNEAIYHARGLWYMSIDDDEWFEDVEDILQFFKTGAYKKCSCATYIQRNYTDSQGKLFDNHHTYRMAEITPELHFEGRIHDALNVDPQGTICQLKSYAHHYGFANDQPGKMRAKFMRNTSILLQDIYEYPENLRYLFQLANEYEVIRENEVAIRLFAQCVALAKETGDVYRGRNSTVKLLDGLYGLNDERMFAWAEYLEQVFPLIVAERAFCAWCLCSLSFVTGKPAGYVLSYYNRYEKFLEEYRNDSSPSKSLSFCGLSAVEHDFYVMDVEAVGFCACVKAGEEERALELLERLSLEKVENKRNVVFAEGFAAREEVYEALCEKLTAMQWEEWSDSILDGFGADLTHSNVHQRIAKRFPEALSHISVPSVLSWLEQSEMTRKESVREKLLDYALACVEEGRIFTEESPVQELVLCAQVLKEEYAKRRESEEGGRLLYGYVMATGAFAERYYNPEQLMASESCAIPPDVRAVYRMAAALADGTPSSENVALLKQALEIFPPFHQEIRGILAELAGSGK